MTCFLTSTCALILAHVTQRKNGWQLIQESRSRESILNSSTDSFMRTFLKSMEEPIKQPNTWASNLSYSKVTRKVLIHHLPNALELTNLKLCKTQRWIQGKFSICLLSQIPLKNSKEKMLRASTSSLITISWNISSKNMSAQAFANHLSSTSGNPLRKDHQWKHA